MSSVEGGCGKASFLDSFVEKRLPYVNPWDSCVVGTYTPSVSTRGLGSSRSSHGVNVGYDEPVAMVLDDVDYREHAKQVNLSGVKPY